MICILVQLVNLPISWKKCELGVSITWIGWKFHFRCGYVELPENKLQKIRTLLQKLRRSDKTSMSLIEQFLGLLMWITQLFGTMRTWMHPLYRDLHSIPASQYSVDPGMWDQVIACLNDKLQFIRSPTYSAIPKMSQLLQIRHQKVETQMSKGVTSRIDVFGLEFVTRTLHVVGCPQHHNDPWICMINGYLA